MIFILNAHIKVIPPHCPARSIQKNNIPQHRQARLAEKQLYHSIAQLARPKKKQTPESASAAKSDWLR
jgi:hypothetical protein